MQQHFSEKAGELLSAEGLHRFEGVTAEEMCQELSSQHSRVPGPERAVLFRDAVDSLSENAREVVWLALDFPFEHVCGRWPYLSAISETRCSIRYYLRHCGWKHPVISDVFAEIRDFLRKI